MLSKHYCIEDLDSMIYSMACLVEANIRELVGGISMEAIVRQFAVINFMLPRQIGKSTAIRKLATPDDVVILNSRAASDIFLEGYRKKEIQNLSHTSFLPVKRGLKSNLYKRNWPAIMYVDESNGNYTLRFRHGDPPRSLILGNYMKFRRVFIDNIDHFPYETKGDFIYEKFTSDMDRHCPVFIELGSQTDWNHRLRDITKGPDPVHASRLIKKS